LCAGLALVGGGLLSSCGIGSPPQARRVPTLGWLLPIGSPSFAGPPPPGTPSAAFLDALRDLGYVDGETITIEYRGYEGQIDRLPALAAELVERRVDLIFTSGGTPPARAAQQATTVIPIICAGIGDPVSTGLVASLARPGGNLTGLSTLHPETGAKRLQLLKETVPRVTRVDVINNFANPAVEREWDDLQDPARRLGLSLTRRDARDPSQIEAALAAMTAAYPDAVVLGGEGVFFVQRQRLINWAAALGIPTLSLFREFVVEGALMSYGPNLVDLFRKAAGYVDKVLWGAKPADLPIEQPTAFDFVLNLKTAQALGLTIPQAILHQSTEVIQ
jgi:putative ABC transport system substrate-binding protein